MVKTGLTWLVREQARLFSNQRIGLVTHPAAVLPDLTIAADALMAAGIQVTVLFGPEHGFYGSAADGAAVDDCVDERTGLTVHSLYGTTKIPTPAMLANLDLLIFDLQDVGVRYYTFTSTLYYVLKSAAAKGTPVVVLDRPDPINGTCIEGPLVDPGYESFVGIMPIPARYGMTLGEIARYINGEFGLEADLSVIEMRGWRREMWFDQTGLPWVPPSPAMPHLSTATVYPGMCFVEGTNLSEGRGTATPFEIAGAPWLDGYRLAQALNGLALPGVRFRPVRFIPSASKHAGQVCEGIQVHVMEREAFAPVATGLHVIAAARAQAPDHFEFLSPLAGQAHCTMDLLSGGPAVRNGLAAGVAVEELTAQWQEIARHFQAARQRYLLYD